MALRAVPDHPKFARLKRLLKLPKGPTLGYLECLWHFCGKYTPQGNVGKYSDDEIEAWIEWEGEAGALVDAFVGSGWIDRSEQHRLVVHDWHQHADDATKLALKRSKSSFVTTVSRQCSDKVGSTPTQSGLPEPVPEPVPVPEPELTPDIAARVLSEKVGNLNVRFQEQMMRMIPVSMLAGETLERIVDRMAEQWEKYKRAGPDLDYSYGSVAKFFESGRWHDEKLWPWKEGADGKPDDDFKQFLKQKLADSERAEAARANAASRAN